MTLVRRRAPWPRSATEIADEVGNLRTRPSSRLTQLALARRGRRSASLAAIATVLLPLALGVLDYASGTELSLEVFYVLIVVAVTLVGGHRCGTGAVVASAAVWTAAKWRMDERQEDAWVFAWNVIARVAALGIVMLLVARLVRALEAAQASDRRSREFLAAAAHQLRTPIAALRASADALMWAGVNPVQEQLLADVTSESARAGRLIGSLLRMARLDQGEPVRLEGVDLGELVAAELDRMRQLSTLEFRLTLEESLSPIVVLDTDATRDALANVLDNARRHAHAVVDVTVRRTDGFVVLVVRDDGPGLPAGSEDRAFDRFVTFDGLGGSGLGLPIARALTRIQGGDVVYEDRSFVISLPMRTPMSPPEPQRPRSTRASRRATATA